MAPKWGSRKATEVPKESEEPTAVVEAQALHTLEAPTDGKQRKGWKSSLVPPPTLEASPPADVEPPPAAADSPTKARRASWRKASLSNGPTAVATTSSDTLPEAASPKKAAAKWGSRKSASPSPTSAESQPAPSASESSLAEDTAATPAASAASPAKFGRRGGWGSHSKSPRGSPQPTEGTPAEGKPAEAPKSPRAWGHRSADSPRSDVVPPAAPVDPSDSEVPPPPPPWPPSDSPPTIRIFNTTAPSGEQPGQEVKPPSPKRELECFDREASAYPSEEHAAPPRSLVDKSQQGRPNAEQDIGKTSQPFRAQLSPGATADGVSTAGDFSASGFSLTLDTPSELQLPSSNIDLGRASGSGPQDRLQTSISPSRGSQVAFTPRQSQSQDPAAYAFMSHKRWLDLQSSLRSERESFYDKVVRSDLLQILQGINAAEVIKIKALLPSHAPGLMQEVLSNVHTLLGLPDDWATCRRNLQPLASFMQQLERFQYSSITMKQLQEMRRRLKRVPAAFSPDVVQTISGTCAALCRWVNVMCWRAGEQSRFHADVGLLQGELDKETISCMASYVRPPVIVASVLGNVHCLLGLDDDWLKIQNHLKSASVFLQQLQYFDQATVTKQMLQAMQRRQNLYPHSFCPEVVVQVNAPCGVLCRWVNAVCLRAGLDLTAANTGPRARTRSPGSPRTPASPRHIAHSNLEEMPGWSERVPIETQFIRPDDNTMRGSSRSPSMRGSRNSASLSPRNFSASGGPYSTSTSSDPLSKRYPGGRTAVMIGQTAPRYTDREAPRVYGSIFGTTTSPNTMRLSSDAALSTVGRNVESPQKGAVSSLLTTPIESENEDEGGRRHPDSDLLSSLEGPAVIATVGGVLRNPPKNPELVAFVLGNVHCLLGLDPRWESVLESLHNFENFVRTVLYLDESSITMSKLDALSQREMACPEAFNPTEVAQSSNSASKFATWVNAARARASGQ